MYDDGYKDEENELVEITEDDVLKTVEIMYNEGLVDFSADSEGNLVFFLK